MTPTELSQRRYQHHEPQQVADGSVLPRKAKLFRLRSAILIFLLLGSRMVIPVMLIRSISHIIVQST
jgi:hypothetical protein